MDSTEIKRVTVGIVAHVDAGKTTLSESMLYLTGKIRDPGRVDDGSAHLDSHALEKQRGITIFSSQAVIRVGNTELMLLDTPGHVDFASEMERTLAVLDCAVLVISGTDGVQAHTETLWRLLRRYDVPTFIFITKMDMSGTDGARVAGELKAKLDKNCVDFSSRESYTEDAAACDEALLEKYLSIGELNDADIADAISQRKVFPYFFGSGLKMDGVETFLRALALYAGEPEHKSDFGARVFKISRDAQNKRLTWMKLTGGTLSVRAPLHYTARSGEEMEEKVSQLRVYSGEKYESFESLPAGSVCAALGLSETYPGQALGGESAAIPPALEPVLTYRVLPPSGCDERELFPKLRLLEEEDPQLRVAWEERTREIQIQLMGEVQTEVLKSLVQSRFGLDVDFDEGRILYKETIAAPVEGLGHFEPLRHYAEVRLLLEPLPLGSGMEFASSCPTDMLAGNYQRLVLTHLAERQHRGVLAGAPITDMRITLTAGRAHIKHTEGGDFRQATYRAVRQGLMRADSVLLEPYYSFQMELPTEFIGHALNDIERMYGKALPPETRGETSLLRGRAPVSAIRGYIKELTAYTRGRGRLSCYFDGYDICRSSAEVMAQACYFPEADVENIADSVFCEHGAGVNVKWDRVEARMHAQSTLKNVGEDCHKHNAVSDKELEAIMLKTVGPIKRPVYGPAERTAAPPAAYSIPKDTRLVIDGYNVIFAWDELKALAEESLEAARGAFMDILCEYRAAVGSDITLVFDAYRTDNMPCERFEYKNIHVVFTAKEETADVYIARMLHEDDGKYKTRVVTSDHLIRLAAWGNDALMTGAREFKTEAEGVKAHIREIITANRHKTGSSIQERIVQQREP